MTPSWLAELDDVPPQWKLVPCNGNKTPIDPKTGFPRDDWHPLACSAEEFKKLPRGRIKAVGLALGPASGGLLAVDFDAEGYEAVFQMVYDRPVTDLPKSISWSSGKPGRKQVAYSVPDNYWIQLRNRKVWNNQNKKTCLELRWDCHQSVLLGAHPETAGYHWQPGCSPRDLPLAKAPEWLLVPLKQQEQLSRTPSIEKNTNDECEQARHLLNYIKPRDSYDEWLKVGMALHSTDPALLQDWINWSRSTNCFDENECVDKWHSFKRSGITIGTLHYMAKIDSGYQVDDLISHASESKPSSQTKCNLRWGEVISQMLQAIEDGDEDLEMELRATIMNTYRRSDQQVDAALFKLHTKRISGHKKANKLQSVDLSKIKASDWLITGFVIKNDLTLIYGNAGSGKTTVAIGLANALIRGTGFLDYQIDTTPGKVLFIASDSGAQPLLSALQNMSLADQPGYKTDQSQKFHVVAADPDQNTTQWNISLANCIGLQAYVVENEIDLVIIDSAKAVFSSAGLDYSDNNLVTSVLTYFKQVICVSTSVIFINHDGRDKGAAAGAKAWKEIPSIVHQIKRPDEKKNEGVKSFREWTCAKNRLGNERQFHYQLSDGELAVAQATEIIGSCIDEIFKLLRESPTGEMSLNEFCKHLTPSFSRGTIKNTLTNAVNCSKPQLKRVPNKRGYYRLNHL